MTMISTPPEPGMPSKPVAEIDEPEHDELSRLSLKLLVLLDEAEDVPTDVGFDQREVDVIAYLRAFAGRPLVIDDDDDDSVDDHVVGAFIGGLDSVAATG